MWRLALTIGLMPLATSAHAAGKPPAIIHEPDFAQQLGGYASSEPGIRLTADPDMTPSGRPSLRIECQGVSGRVTGPAIRMEPTHRSGYLETPEMRNLVYWRVQYGLRAALDQGGYRIRLRILDGDTPYEIPFDYFGGAERIVKGFRCVDRPLCAITTTHPNVRRSGGKRDAELVVYLDDADGTLWLADVRIAQASPGGKGFSAADWDAFETVDGVHYFGAMEVFQPAYAVTDYSSRLIMDTAHKLLRAAGFNMIRFPVYWGDHFGRPEDKILIENSKPDGSGNYDESLERYEQALDCLEYYGYSLMPILRGSPGWTHPQFSNLHGTAGDAADHAPTVEAYGSRYPGPQYATGKHWTYPPDDWKDFRAYAAALVKAGKDRVTVYEVFNEINVSAQASVIGGYKAVGDWVRNFCEVVQAIDPDADVIVGSCDKMLAGLIADGVLECADGVAFHGYTGDLESTRGMVESSGAMKHVWMSEFHGVHPEWVKTVRGQVIWNAFSVMDWEGFANKAKILVLEDAQDRWVHNSAPKGLGDRVAIIQDYHDHGYLSGALESGNLDGLNAPNRIAVDVIYEPEMAYGAAQTVVLRAANPSDRTFHAVHLWPVGFVDNLGFEFEQVREADRFVEVFAPSDMHEIRLELRPRTTLVKAAGIYCIGMVVTNAEGKHTLSWRPLRIIDQ